MHKEYKSIFVKNTLLSIAQRVSSTVITFLLMPYMIWRMGTESYGYWLILQIFSIGGYLALTEMGFQGSITRYLTKFHAEQNELEFRKLYVSGLMLFLLLGVVCLIIVLLFNKFLFVKTFSIPHHYEEELQAGLTVYALSFSFQLPAMVLKAFYTSIQDFLKLKLWETLNVLVFASAVFVIMFSITSVSVVVIIETAVHFTFFTVFVLLPFRKYRNIYSLNIGLFSLRSLKQISGMTFYLFFYRLFGLIYNKTPQIFIAYFLTPNYMTYYSIISKIPRMLKTMQGMINSAVLPLAVSLDTLDYQYKMKNLFLRGTRYSFVFLTPVVVFTFLYAGDILDVWVGADFVFLENYLRIYLIWQYLNFLISFGSSMYTRTEHFKSMLPYYIAGTAVFLLTMSFFIQEYELWAILSGLMISSCVIIPSSIFVINKFIRFSFREFFNYVLKSPVFFAALLCTVFVLFTRTFLPSESTILLIAYAMTMYVFYLLFFYRYCFFDIERNDVSLFLKSYGKNKS